MSDLTNQLDADLKQAMLGGDKRLTSVLRGLKSALQYARVDGGSELSDQQVISVLQKESKKRSDAIELYKKANETERTENEEYEKQIIDNYLPDMLGEDEIAKLVDAAIEQQGGLTQQTMGKVIGQVRQKSEGRADGAVIARLVKEKLGQ